jgi:hypothetical protein
MIRRSSCAVIFALVLGGQGLIGGTRPSFAEEPGMDARQRLLVAADKLEEKIKSTRWDFNHLSEKKALEADLVEINKINEAIALYEHELRCPAFPGSFGSRATDDEVALIATIVHLRGLVNDTSRWNFNNLDEQKKMKAQIATSESALQEMKVRHCG